VCGVAWNALWQACSACAGDYEDPDRTAGEEFEDLLGGDDEYVWRGILWAERAELAELDGADTAAVRRGIAEARNVSAEEIF
jgi:hypothetical protein